MPVVATLPLDAIIIAVLALILILAGPVLAPFLEKMFSYVPVIGGWMAKSAQYWYQVALGALYWGLKSTLNPLTAQLHLLTVAWQYSVSALGFAVRQVDLAADHIVNVVIPRVYNGAISYAAYLANGLLAYIDGRITFVESYADYLVNGLLAYVNSGLSSVRNYAAYLANGLLAYADARIAATVAYAANLINGLLAYTNSWITTIRADLVNLRSYVDAKWADLFHTVEADILSAEQRAEALALSYARQALIDALGITDQAAIKALTDIWPHLATDLNALEHAIPADLTDILDDIRAIPRAIPGSLVDALSALGALAIPLIRYLEDCGIPLCRNLHGLSDLMDNLFSAATDAAMLALFAEMVSNPHAAADAILTVAGPIANVSATATRDLLGV